MEGKTPQTPNLETQEAEPGMDADVNRMKQLAEADKQAAAEQPPTPQPDPILARIQQVQMEMQQLSQQLNQATSVVHNLEAQVHIRQGALMELERLQPEEAS